METRFEATAFILRMLVDACADDALSNARNFLGVYMNHSAKKKTAKKEQCNLIRTTSSDPHVGRISCEKGSIRTAVMARSTSLEDGCHSQSEETVS